MWGRLRRPSQAFTLARLCELRAVDVRNDLNLQCFRHFPVDVFEELQPLQVGVTCLGVVDRLAFQIVQLGEAAYAWLDLADDINLVCPRACKMSSLSTEISVCANISDL